MMTHTRSCLNSMESEFEWEQSRLANVAELLSLANAQEESNTKAVAALFAEEKDSDSDFCALYNPKGELYWKTENLRS